MILTDVFFSVFVANFLTIALIGMIYSVSTLIRINLIENQTNQNHD
jgi:hypothetical protein